jgi:AraC family transcriptional regulator
MPSGATQTEHDRRVAEVVDYIFKHISEELSIDILAGAAHYSPDHLQKLFKKAVGESPKQYSLKLRLETAFLFLIVHPEMPISAIALDCGFSSPAVFSRAVSNHFGYSPLQLRGLPHRQRMSILHGNRPRQEGAGQTMHEAEDFVAPEIQVVHRERLRGFYRLTAFDNPVAIRGAFKLLARFASARGLETTSMHGILSPLRRNSYRAFLPIWTDNDAPFPSCEIPGGAFARFSVTGDLHSTRRAVHYLGHRWLPVNGYRVAGYDGFETFEVDPGSRPYFQLRRQIHIPIERIV